MWRFLNLGLISAALALMLLSWGARTPAQPIAQTSINLESRLSQLESVTYNLRSQVSQLTAEVNRLGTGSRAPRVTPSTPGTRSPKPSSSDDPQFDRLATLVIELKERMDAIDTRLTQVEKRLSSR